MEAIINPLEAVKLIPIFNYINILSDFLYFEHYLEEIDQNKQIPIVNALYEYLDDHQNNKFKKAELIRALLQGSDMYGANIGEHVDVTFVNVMFDYIISSLVFDKYGNIYGFLADVFCKVENLQFEKVLNIIRINLQNASFDNEYGSSSTLSDLSVARIYNDIILPLFPQPNDSLNLLSLDYIYAQAGSMFLRAGRINSNNYINFESNTTYLTEDNLFNEYLVIGHVIESFILTDEKNVDMLKAFALPALTYSIFNYKHLFANDNTANLISDSTFWHSAYVYLFQYTTACFDAIEDKLKNDYTLKIYSALLRFQSCSAFANDIIEHHCPKLDIQERIFKFLFFSYYPFPFRCKIDESLLNPKEYFKNQMNNITELYETFELQLVQNNFPKALLQIIEREKVIVKLLVPNNLVLNHNIHESEYLSYDILEFFFPHNLSANYYILKRENSNVILINTNDNSQLFPMHIRQYLEKLYTTAYHKILKTADENSIVFFHNLVEHKKSRFESQLNILNNCEEDKGQLNNNWWKEFDLSLVPYYPCLANLSETNNRNYCVSNNTNIYYKHLLDITSKAINNYSQSILSSSGTNIRSLILKYASFQTVAEILTEEREYRLTLKNPLIKNKIFQDISLNINDPAFQLTFIAKDDINLFKRIIYSLREKTDFNFTLVTSSLSMITKLKSNSYKSIGTIGANSSRLIFINTLNNRSDTGYGYKFTFLSENIKEIAQLRTGYELKDQRLFTQGYKEKEKKMYIALSNITFQIEPDHIMYEINNQFWRRPTRYIFSGITILADDYNENCSDNKYFEMWKNYNICRRRQRFNAKSIYLEYAVKFIQKDTSFSEEQIRHMLEKYTFSDNTTLMRFVNDLLNDNSFKEPIWSKNYIIENPALLNELRFNLRFEEHTTISEYDAEFRINYLYTKAERYRIEEETSIKNIVKEYNEKKSYFSVSFHDYYAIRNYATTGYKRITCGSHEAKLMKMALYKLAIRQSDDDPYEEIYLKLFRIETKPITIRRIMSTKMNITLQKFTQASSSVDSVTRFAGYPQTGYINILYEMIFNGSYPRIKIEQFYNKKEKNVILLPGSEFFIEDSTMLQLGGLGNVLKLKLIFKDNFNDKYVWYRNIMNEIAHIKF
ncbi:uncharacterized protein LOC127280834 [Leptopilina boulardi]|uniref:uncharacterized protein LOC127280834 n=1 Tax=Leptopilina boulardi TaxID=63433 RepID=UPI0021F6022C|nr:uncharacterized protein LOC127280834 [Leptopilina boulardi]